MSRAVRVAAIIPARMASSRLPGKPLLDIHGIPMVEHVRRRAMLCGRFSEVVVASCDDSIAQVIRRYGGRCLMTSPEHPGATDRVAEAARQLNCTHVVNVQGDEVLVLVRDLERLVNAIEAEPEVPAWNAVTRLQRAEELSDRAIVKCAMSQSGRILYCARDFSAIANALPPDFEPIYRIVGVLAYTRAFLDTYVTLPRTPLERAEGIDQSRILEHDVMLRGVWFTKGYPGINEPREIQMVRQYLQDDPAQQAILQEVLQG